MDDPQFGVFNMVNDQARLAAKMALMIIALGLLTLIGAGLGILMKLIWQEVGKKKGRNQEARDGE